MSAYTLLYDITWGTGKGLRARRNQSITVEASSLEDAKDQAARRIRADATGLSQHQRRTFRIWWKNNAATTALLLALTLPASAQSGLTSAELAPFDPEWKARLSNCDTYSRNGSIVVLDCEDDRVTVDLETRKVLRLESRRSRLATFVKWALPLIMAVVGGGAACANDRC